MPHRSKSFPIALGGVLAALAVVVMCLGGMIPLATFVCPMACIVLLAVVLQQCGSRMAWAWYAAVAILSLLLGPDKEAAAVFTFLGYYPIVKRKLDRLPLRWLWKGLFFNTVIVVMYWLLLYVFGVAQLIEEFAEMGTVLTVVTLMMGNAVFFLLDMLLAVRRKG